MYLLLLFFIFTFMYLLKYAKKTVLIVVLSLQFVVVVDDDDVVVVAVFVVVAVVVVVVVDNDMLPSVSIVLYLEVTYMYRMLIAAIIKTYFRKSLRLDLRTLSTSLYFYSDNYCIFFIKIIHFLAPNDNNCLYCMRYIS